MPRSGVLQRSRLKLVIIPGIGRRWATAKKIITSSGRFIGTVQLANENPMHGRLRPYLICSWNRRAGWDCGRVNRQSHHQQELQRYPHGRQFTPDLFIKQLAIHRTGSGGRRSKKRRSCFGKKALPILPVVTLSRDRYG